MSSTVSPDETPPAVKPVQPIRPAATVILIREAPVSYEIFMLKRTSKASFASGMYVFPGGKVDGDDHLHKYDAHMDIGMHCIGRERLPISADFDSPTKVSMQILPTDQKTKSTCMVHVTLNIFIID